MKYIVGILLCKLLQPLLNKKCSMALSDTSVFIKYILVRQIAAAGIALLLSPGALASTQPRMLLYGMLFALCLTVCTYAGIAAMQHAPMVLVSMFEMAGLLVPCVAGIFLFQEPLSPLHGIGLLLCMLSAWILTAKGSRSRMRMSLKSWLLLIACLLSNGGIMLTQKLFSYSLPDGNIGVFHFWGFFFSALFSLLLLLFVKRPEHAAPKVSFKIYLYGIILSAALLAISMLSTVASASLPSVVLFSAANGGGLLLSALISVLVYREKITGKIVLGLVLGIVALMIINFA